MFEQLPEVTILDSRAAKALMNTRFLSRFLDPASPTDVARQLGMPANLAHYHAKKYKSLGLLSEVARDNGMVFYQLSGRRFRIRYEEERKEEQSKTPAVLLARRLFNAFAEEYRKSEVNTNHDDDLWTVCSFETGDSGGLGEAASGSNIDNAFSISADLPTFLIQRTMKMSPDSYKKLLLYIEKVIQDQKACEVDSRSATCTIAAIGFRGRSYDNQGDNSMARSSFFAEQTEAEA